MAAPTHMKEPNKHRAQAAHLHSANGSQVVRSEDPSQYSARAQELTKGRYAPTKEPGLKEPELKEPERALTTTSLLMEARGESQFSLADLRDRRARDGQPFAP